MSVDGGQRPPDPPPPPPPPPEKVEEPVGSRTWEASADLQLQQNADYFDAEALRYGEIGDYGAAGALQDAGDRARSLIGGNAAGDAATAGSEAMERWEASEDRILRDNADYFDAEAKRYAELGDHDAASSSQDAGDLARSFIGGGAQSDSGDTSPSPPDDHFDSAGTGNEDPTGGQDPAADTASDSQERTGSTVAGSDEMSSWDASADEQDARDQDQREQDARDQDQREQDARDQDQREQDARDQVKKKVAAGVAGLAVAISGGGGELPGQWGYPRSPAPIHQPETRPASQGSDNGQVTDHSPPNVAQVGPIEKPHMPDGPEGDPERVPKPERARFDRPLNDPKPTHADVRDNRPTQPRQGQGRH